MSGKKQFHPLNMLSIQQISTIYKLLASFASKKNISLESIFKSIYDFAISQPAEIHPSQKIEEAATINDGSDLSASTQDNDSITSKPLSSAFKKIKENYGHIKKKVTFDFKENKYSDDPDETVYEQWADHPEEKQEELIKTKEEKEEERLDRNERFANRIKLLSEHDASSNAANKIFYREFYERAKLEAEADFKTLTNDSSDAEKKALSNYINTLESAESIHTKKIDSAHQYHSYPEDYYDLEKAISKSEADYKLTEERALSDLENSVSEDFFINFKYNNLILKNAIAKAESDGSQAIESAKLKSASRATEKKIKKEIKKAYKKEMEKNKKDATSNKDATSETKEDAKPPQEAAPKNFEKIKRPIDRDPEENKMTQAHLRDAAQAKQASIDYWNNKNNDKLNFKGASQIMDCSKEEEQLMQAGSRASLELAMKIKTQIKAEPELKTSTTGWIAPIEPTQGDQQEPNSIPQDIDVSTEPPVMDSSPGNDSIETRDDAVASSDSSFTNGERPPSPENQQQTEIPLENDGNPLPANQDTHSSNGPVPNTGSNSAPGSQINYADDDAELQAALRASLDLALAIKSKPSQTIDTDDDPELQAAILASQEFKPSMKLAPEITITTSTTAPLPSHIPFFTPYPDEEDTQPRQSDESIEDARPLVPSSPWDNPIDQQNDITVTPGPIHSNEERPPSHENQPQTKIPLENDGNPLPANQGTHSSNFLALNAGSDSSPTRHTNQREYFTRALEEISIRNEVSWITAGTYKHPPFFHKFITEHPAYHHYLHQHSTPAHSPIGYQKNTELPKSHENIDDATPTTYFPTRNEPINQENSIKETPNSQEIQKKNIESIAPEIEPETTNATDSIEAEGEGEGEGKKDTQPIDTNVVIDTGLQVINYSPLADPIDQKNDITVTPGPIHSAEESLRLAENLPPAGPSSEDSRNALQDNQNTYYFIPSAAMPGGVTEQDDSNDQEADDTAGALECALSDVSSPMDSHVDQLAPANLAKTTTPPIVDITPFESLDLGGTIPTSSAAHTDSDSESASYTIPLFIAGAGVGALLYAWQRGLLSDYIADELLGDIVACIIGYDYFE